ncbi:hypothetical protein VKT23_011757 [Stygiomarasmius scandens]|uniref:Uncharacterized protein n=1 Tax=Marasmiellus scandens TaxID=2682957 RepID=A0ABR1JDH4_9AGAR
MSSVQPVSRFVVSSFERNRSKLTSADIGFTELFVPMAVIIRKKRIRYLFQRTSASCIGGSDERCGMDCDLPRILRLFSDSKPDAPRKKILQRQFSCS